MWVLTTTSTSSGRTPPRRPPREVAPAQVEQRIAGPLPAVAHPCVHEHGPPGAAHHPRLERHDRAVAVGVPVVGGERLAVLLPDAGRQVRDEGAGFHVVLAGGCRLVPETGGEPVTLGAGDVAPLPHGAGDVLADSPGDTSRAVPFEEKRGPDGGGDGDGRAVELLCGKCRLDRSRAERSCHHGRATGPALGPGEFVATRPRRPDRRRTPPRAAGRGRTPTPGSTASTPRSPPRRARAP